MSAADFKSIAVVGVSENQQKYGHRIFVDLLEAGYPVVGININGGTVNQQRLFKTLAELPIIPDLVISVVPPMVTQQVIEQANYLGVKDIWLQPGSESETAIAKATQLGMKVTANRCFMKDEGIW